MGAWTLTVLRLPSPNQGENSQKRKEMEQIISSALEVKRSKINLKDSPEGMDKNKS